MKHAVRIIDSLVPGQLIEKGFNRPSNDVIRSGITFNEYVETNLPPIEPVVRRYKDYKVGMSREARLDIPVAKKHFKERNSYLNAMSILMAGDVILCSDLIDLMMSSVNNELLRGSFDELTNPVNLSGGVLQPSFIGTVPNTVSCVDYKPTTLMDTFNPVFVSGPTLLK
jgi:hypothetical protein